MRSEGHDHFDLTIKKAFSMTSAILGDRSDWDLVTRDSIVGRWFRTAYYLRNRVAHAGHEPEEGEAEKANI